MQAPQGIAAVTETACTAVVPLFLPLVVDVGQGENWRAAHQSLFLSS